MGESLCGGDASPEFINDALAILFQKSTDLGRQQIKNGFRGIRPRGV
jgi:hypothetical protein